MSIFQLNFVYEAYLKNYTGKYREVSFEEDVYGFRVNYNSFDKSEILNIHKYLMAKNNIK